MILRQELPLIICSITVAFSFIVVDASNDLKKNLLSYEQKRQVFFEYGLNKTVDSGQIIQLTDVRSRVTLCFDVSATSGTYLTPDDLIQVSCPIRDTQEFIELKSALADLVENTHANTITDASKVPTTDGDLVDKLTSSTLYMELYYNRNGSIISQEKIKLRPSFNSDSSIYYAREYDDPSDESVTTDNQVPTIALNRIDPSNDEENTHVTHSLRVGGTGTPDIVKGRIFGGTGGSGFNDSQNFAWSSVAQEYRPSRYDITHCEGSELSIQFTYSNIDGRSPEKLAARHGPTRGCGVTQITMFNGYGIKKVLVATKTLNHQSPPRTIIVGIQFFMDTWESPLYGSHDGIMSGEMSDTHVLWYISGRADTNIDQIQFTWIRSQPTFVPTTMRTSIWPPTATPSLWIPLNSNATCQIRCANPTRRRCILRSYMCDGDEDCTGGTDEDPKYCAPGCQSDQVRCVNPGFGPRCVSKSWMCDGARDCGDGSDENPAYCDLTGRSVANITTSMPSPQVHLNTNWTVNETTAAGGQGQGRELNQLNYPFGLCVDDNQTLYVADTFNDRIVEWKYGAISGQVVAGGNGEGNRTHQLNKPTDIVIDKGTNNLIICDRENRRVVRWTRPGGTSGQTIISGIYCWGLTMDDQGFLYVSDTENDEVRRWRVGEANGTVVAGGNGQGDRLDQLDQPIFVFVDRNHSVYVSDQPNNRVMKWMKGAKEGIVVVGGQGRGTALTQLWFPQGVFVDELGNIYIADYLNNRIMRWPPGATQGSIVVGGNGQGDQANQLNRPVGLTFDRQNNLYVADKYNNRVQRFLMK